MTYIETCKNLFPVIRTRAEYILEAVNLTSGASPVISSFLKVWYYALPAEAVSFRSGFASAFFVALDVVDDDSMAGDFMAARFGLRNAAMVSETIVSMMDTAGKDSTYQLFVAVGQIQASAIDLLDRMLLLGRQEK